MITVDRTLDELATVYGTDKGPEEHGYTQYYERHFAPLRHERVDLVEIGVLDGASLEMWADWFADVAVVGIDIAPRVDLQTDTIRTITCDVKSWDPSSWGGFDIVVDDGSHAALDIAIAHDLLWPMVRPGGWYVIEDLDVQGPGSAVHELVYRSVRELSHEIGDVGELHVYPQIVFFRKRSNDG